ncbi:MAG TPA: threonine--tRNA ligase [Pirellulaceae bacterium]|nr:threonine--tRNA ligase [Pirellulaceae bacterium]
MLNVHLPDGSVKQFDSSVTPGQVAAGIGAGLAKASIAAEVDGVVVGMDHKLPAAGDVKLRILTKKDPEALNVMRHSAAHIMARAVMRLHEGVQLAFGPTVEGGFYYDIQSPKPITESDFPAIEAEMAKIIKANEPFERLEESHDKSVKICQDLGQQFKVEHINDGLKDHATLSFYRQGEFLDLCRGPHVPSAGAIGAFKLLSVAGAYWKGDQEREQLQRLYATAFFSKEDLDAHLAIIEEAKKRDHRTLGKQLDLFTISPMVGAGLVLWQPKGALIRQNLEAFVRDELKVRGYSPVYTPHIGSLDLYRTSGHYPYYADSQFPPLFDHPLAWTISEMLGQISDENREQMLKIFDQFMSSDLPANVRVDLKNYHKLKSPEDRVSALSGWLADREQFLLKPMNCPHHVMIYKSKPRSYRELPLRLAEFGSVYRYEKSGQLNGMTRVRGFTQDDAHIFCTNEQVGEEFRRCIEMTQYVLNTLGLKNYRVRLGFRDPKSDKYVGNPETWERAQAALVAVCTSLGMEFESEEGEAAFYGPKADFVVTDCIGREWQLGTVQLDYNLPSASRFALEYIGPDNRPHEPVMIHRAPLGSLERFIGVLIEHFAGAFPLWLAPEQVRVLVVSEKFEEYAREVEAQLLAAGLRATGDYRPEKIGAKIRDAQLELIPYMFVIGGREVESHQVAVRDRIDGDLGAMPVGTAVEKLLLEVAARTVRKTYEGGTGLGDRGAKNEY